MSSRQENAMGIRCDAFSSVQRPVGECGRKGGLRILVMARPVDLRKARELVATSKSGTPRAGGRRDALLPLTRRCPASGDGKGWGHRGCHRLGTSKHGTGTVYQIEDHDSGGPRGCPAQGETAIHRDAFSRK